MADNTSPACATIESGTSTAERGQVCDRCRLKKTKCNGSKPCDKCAAVDADCIVSTKLRRKTKARGYSTTEAYALKRLEDENAELKKQLQAESQAKQRLQEQLSRSSYRPAHKKRRTDDHLVSVSSASDTTTLDRNAFVVKHMGRLVRDDVDVGRFAGSTTGVHLVLSVQEMCHVKFPSLEPFPEVCYRSYLLQPNRDASLLYRSAELTPLTVQDARNFLGITLEDVARQFLLFETYWSGFCASTIREQALLRARYLLTDLPEPYQLQAEDFVILQTILLILLINRPSEAESDATENAWLQGGDLTLQLVCQIHRLISTRVEPMSLQALVLFSLYVQKSGKRQWMTPLNGAMVQMAQSLGLHRHARRFKFSAAEVEWRKRLWWSVFAFDKITAVVHGLPQLIHDADVDNDFPVDCVLQDTVSAQLSHPLPGEPTPVSMFCHYVKLTSILSRMLGQLYTTTDRRGGADKIKQLDLDLQVWASDLKKHPHVTRLDLGDSMHRRKKDRNFDEDCLILPWLEVVANITRILIHLPGLTFDRSTTQFQDSLQRCVLSAATIVGLLNDDDLDPRISILSPCGPSIIFQCGLLQIFNQCNAPTEDHHRDTVREQNREILHQSVDLLEDLAFAYIKTSASETSSPLSNLVETLVRLQSALDTYEGPEHNFDAVNMNLDLAMAPGLETSSLGPQVDVWGTTALESLNQFGDFDSLFDFVPVFN